MKSLEYLSLDPEACTVGFSILPRIRSGQIEGLCYTIIRPAKDCENQRTETKFELDL
jgi:hypothetical protein